MVDPTRFDTMINWAFVGSSIISHEYLIELSSLLQLAYTVQLGVRDT